MVTIEQDCSTEANAELDLNSGVWLYSLEPDADPDAFTVLDSGVLYYARSNIEPRDPETF